MTTASNPHDDPMRQDLSSPDFGFLKPGAERQHYSPKVTLPVNRGASSPNHSEQPPSEQKMGPRAAHAW